MPPPFLVLATQNPIDQEGTYRLPEAQLDRFIFKIEVGYPTVEEEISILTDQHNKSQKDILANIPRIITTQQIAQFRETVLQLLVEPRLLTFIAKVVNET